MGRFDFRLLFPGAGGISVFRTGCGLVAALTMWAAQPTGSTAQSARQPVYSLDGLPELGLPVDCAGTDICSVQNYLDFAPGPEARDHNCGPLTYDGHRGIDIRLKTLKDMNQGVAVLAAAAGTVIASRNDVPDKFLSEAETRQTLSRRPVVPSNSVSIHHGKGWMTHYAHMRKGSVSVKPGQKVRQGEAIGLIGASGSTNFPHLHFSLQLHDRFIDPFSGLEPDSSHNKVLDSSYAPDGGCKSEFYHSFWNAEAARLLAYRTSGLLDAGFAPHPPSVLKIQKGYYDTQPLSATAKQLAFWVQIWGLRRNDRIRMRLFAANGELLADITQQANATEAINIRYLSIRRQTDSWPKGTYRGEYLLERSEKDGLSEDGGENFTRILKVIRETDVR